MPLLDAIRRIAPHEALIPADSEARTARDVVLLAVVALGLRLAFLQDAPLWTDELFSVYWSQLPVDFLAGAGARLETNPPGYFLLLHTWMAVFGTSVLSVRMPSVLFSVGGVLLVYALGRMTLDRPTALVAGALAALDATSIHFAQEARGYALAALLDAAMLLAMAGVLRGGGPGGRPAPWGWLALFVLAAAGSVLVHYTSLLVVAACCGVIGLGLVSTRPFPVRAAWMWAGVGLVVAMGLAWPVGLAASLSGSENIAWIPGVSMRSLERFGLELAVHPGVDVTWKSEAATAVPMGLIAAGLWRWRPGRWRLTVLVGPAVLFLLLLVTASLWRPLMISRSGVWLIIPGSLLLACAVRRLPRQMLRVAGVAVAFLMASVDLLHYRASFETEDWPEAARLVATEPACGGPVMFGGPWGEGLVHHQPELAQRGLYTVPQPGTERTAEAELTRRVLAPTVVESRDLLAFLQSHPGAALVARGYFLTRPPPLLDVALAQARFRAVLGDGLTVTCF